MFKEPESEYIDYKECWHNNKAVLLHDILCLANAHADNDRYLIFGVSDDQTCFPGIDNDPNRKRQHDIIDWLRSCALNRVPSVELSTVSHEGKEIDILRISNQRHKPYFPTKLYNDKGKSIAAGAIHTRDKDTNTPINKCASDLQMEQMYLERFGIHQHPTKRAKQYLADVNGWKSGYDEKDQLFLHYSQFPEFTLQCINNDDIDLNSRQFEEPWIHVFPDSKAFRYTFFLKYHGTILDTLRFVWCDGGRFWTAFPEQLVIKDSSVAPFVRSYYFVEGSIAHLASRLIQTHTPSDLKPPEPIFAYFPSKTAAEQEIRGDFAGQKTQFVYYYFNRETNDYFKLTGGKTCQSHKGRNLAKDK